MTESTYYAPPLGLTCETNRFCQRLIKIYEAAEQSTETLKLAIALAALEEKES